MAKKADPRGGRGAGGGTLLKGAAVLGAAAIVSKLIGTMQKIPLQNMAGDAVFGIYNAVYPLYIMILFLATAGFPLVVSKFVSEQVAARRYGEARRVLFVATGVLMCTGVMFFLFLYFGSGWLARLIGAEQTETAIRSVSFALLIVPVMSALRGYYQGYQNMLPTAASQVAEQFVRVAAMFSLLIVLTHAGYGPTWIAAGATFGSVPGAAAGLAVMLWFWRKEKRPRAKSAAMRRDDPGGGPGAMKPGREDAAPSPAEAIVPPGTAIGADALLPGASPEPAGDATLVGVSAPPVESTWKLVRRLTAYALPICLGTIAMPILTLVDSLTMPRLLKAASGDEAAALYQFGLYNHGLPLVQLVGMIASSMSAALVPAIADAKWRGEAEAIRRRTEVAVRLTWFIGLGAAFGIAALAVPLNVMFYKTAEGSTAMAILGFTALLATLNIVAGSVLQGCGAVVAPALYLLVAAALKVAGNVLLMPRWGIDGAAVSAVAAYLAAGGLALAHVLRVTGVAFSLAAYVYRPLVAVAAMAAALIALQAAAGGFFAPGRGAATAVSLAGVLVGALLYGLALLRTGAIRENELLLVPGLKPKHMELLRKFRLSP
ncbi:putative polysaccharide biosynthesis protein [Paenibacillus hamazuiensis]|uniref:putative polysaccharide biosynthesis protein n=1 Tax=Paenibacillus hamazuiensis TaxID=2936508 RepID=UPI00200DDE9A|nr:polysaccharide biosynthesis protein [Paenibacillus hamazuiensis]